MATLHKGDNDEIIIIIIIITIIITSYHIYAGNLQICTLKTQRL